MIKYQSKIMGIIINPYQSMNYVYICDYWCLPSIPRIGSFKFHGAQASAKPSKARSAAARKAEKAALEAAALAPGARLSAGWNGRLVPEVAKKVEKHGKTHSKSWF